MQIEIKKKKDGNKTIRMRYRKQGGSKAKDIIFSILDEKAQTGYRFKLRFEDLIRFVAQETDSFMIPKEYLNEIESLIKDMGGFIKKIKNYKKLAYRIKTREVIE